MRIGLAGPVSPRSFRDHLAGDRLLAEGLGSTLLGELTDELLGRGHTVDVFTLAPEMTEPVTLLGDGLTLHVGRHRRRGRARDLFRVEREDLRRAMLGARPDVIHAHWTYEFAMAALETDFPTIITAHDVAPIVAGLMPISAKP